MFTLLQRLCSTRAPCPGSKREPYLSSTCFFCFSQYIAFKKMTRAALIIQNQYRTHREHERFKKSRRAAAIIQNTFRSYRERRRSTQRRREQRLSKRQEARYIQKASNRYLYRVEFLRTSIYVLFLPLFYFFRFLGVFVCGRFKRPETE